MDKYFKPENYKLNPKLENYKHDVDQIKKTYNLYKNKSMDTFASNSTIDENKIVNINDICNTCILQNNEKNPEKNASFLDENKSNNMIDFLKTPLIDENNYINEINKEIKNSENMNTYIDNYNNQGNKFNKICMNCSYNNDSYICKDMNCTIDPENYEYNNYNQNDISKLLKMYVNKIFQDGNIKDKTEKNTNYNGYSENVQPSNFLNNNNIVSEIVKEMNIANCENGESGESGENCNGRDNNVIAKNLVNKIQNYLKNSNSISSNIENENNIQKMITNEIRKTDVETNDCRSCQICENNKISKKLEKKPNISDRKSVV